MTRKILGFHFVLVIAFTVAAQQPTVPTGGVVSAASLLPSGAPGANVAPGGIVAIFGSNLGPTPPAGLTGPLPLPTNLGGTTVTIGGLAASLYFSSATQVNAQVPYGLTAGPQQVVVTRAGLSSNPINVTVAATAPAIFTQNSNGRGPGAVQNFVTTGAYPLNVYAAAIVPGGTLIAYGTGGGTLTAPGPATGFACNNQPFTLTATATIGGVNAPVTFAGCPAGFAGLDQYNISVPATIPDGCYLPLQVFLNGVGSNIVTVSVARNGNCNSATTGTQGFAAGVSSGLAILSRLTATIPGLPSLSASSFTATFAKAGPLGSADGSGYPPAGGGCVVEVYRVADPNSLPTVGLPNSAGGTILDAGTLNLTSPSGQAQAIPKGTGGTYSITPSFTGGGFTITTGNWALRGTGGTGANSVGAFGPVNLNIATLFTVTSFGFNATAFSQSQPLTMTWTCPDPSGEVIASISSVNTTTSIFGGAVCTASCSAGTLTVPVSILKQMPASTTGNAQILLFYTPAFQNAPKITASGLDFGYFVYSDIGVSTGLTMSP